MEAIESEKRNIQEIKRDRFVRIVERRVNKVLRHLDSLGKCSNKKNYEYSAENVKQIFDAIEKKIREVKTMYKDSDAQSNTFSLRDR